MAIRIYRQYLVSPNNWRKLFWNTTTRQAYENTLNFGTTISYQDGTIVDVYQKSPGNVVMVVYNSSYNGLATPLTSYPRLFLFESLLYGSSYNTLVYAKCKSLNSPPVFEICIYRHIINDYQVIQYPLSLAPFCEEYEVPQGTVINQTCVGTTFRQWIYDGDDVVIEDTPNSEACGYVAPVPDVVVTETKRIKVDHNCYNNPVYLVWKNKLGGWDQWLFHTTQTETIKTEGLGKFSATIYDLENSESTSKSLGKQSEESLIVGASGLNRNQFTAIKDLLDSPVIYKVETDGSKQVYEIKPGSFVTETKNRANSIEFELILPEKFTVKS
jgi:hypothetical protein